MEALIAWSKSFEKENSESGKKTGKQRKSSSAKQSKGFQ